MRYKIQGSCGENFEVTIDFGFVEAENSSEALEIVWARLQNTDIVKIKSKADFHRYFSVREMPKHSKAFDVIQTVYKHCWKSGGQSYTRLNDALRKALTSTIIAGMLFDLDDVKNIASTFAGGYWFSDDNGEWLFRVAVENNNTSACVSYENYRKRKPFFFEGQRIYVQRQFYWYDKKGVGHRLTCTSFDESGEYFTACSYKNVGDSYRRKIDKRFKIYWSDLSGKRERNG